MNDTLLFLRQVISRPLQVSAMAPSSRFLGKAMAKDLGPHTGRVVEFGPGTGRLTQGILDAGVRPENLTLFEMNPEFVTHLRANFPGVTVHLAGAQTAPQMVEKGVGAVISGVPLLAMPMSLRRTIMAAAFEIFTVQQLVEAVRPGSGDDKPSGLSVADESWAVLLRDLPTVADPVLGGLLERRPFATPLLFVLSKLVRLALGRVRVTGLDKLPKDGAFIITPNHQSYLDPLFVSSLLPYRVWRELFYVGAVEYFETPFTRWVARTVNLVPVDADSNLVPAMQAGAFGLTHGRVLVLFPEGERSMDGTVKKFKKGAPILAQHLHVPIVPVAIKGIHELWPRNRPFNWQLMLPWSGHRITIEFGEQMTFAEGENYADSTTRLRERVSEMWTRTT